ncbi:hypothetical protein V2I01_02575 [Micromonospora sp. BRA006-A]|nr:hypothetical protein [Micromonospora sp. BRA006-A]
MHAGSAEYWDSPGSTVVNLLGFAKAAVTGSRRRRGEPRGQLLTGSRPPSGTARAVPSAYTCADYSAQ